MSSFKAKTGTGQAEHERKKNYNSDPFQPDSK